MVEDVVGGGPVSLRIVAGDRAAYAALARFHYCDARLGPTCQVFALIDGGRRYRAWSGPAGVIVYRPPVPNRAVRNVVTGGFFSGLDRASGLALLNEHVRCISRVIIEPRYRGLGLAGRLVAATLPRVGAAMVEASSVMGRFHPFFERAGMRGFLPGPSVKTERMAAALERVGIDERLWIDSRAVHARIASLDAAQRYFLDGQIARFLQKFGHRRGMPPGPARTDFVLSKLGAPAAYYVWLNPDKPVPGLAINPLA